MSLSGNLAAAFAQLGEVNALLMQSRPQVQDDFEDSIASALAVAFRCRTYEARSSLDENLKRGLQKPLAWFCEQNAFFKFITTEHKLLRSSIGDLVQATWPAPRTILQQRLEAFPTEEDKQEHGTELLHALVSALVLQRMYPEAIEIIALAKEHGVRHEQAEAILVARSLDRPEVFRTEAGKRLLNDIASTVTAQGPIRGGPIGVLGKHVLGSDTTQIETIAMGLAKAGDEQRALEVVSLDKELASSEDFAFDLHIEACVAKGDLDGLLEAVRLRYEVDLSSNSWIGEVTPPPARLFTKAIKAACAQANAAKANILISVMAACQYRPPVDVSSSVVAVNIRTGDLETALGHVDLILNDGNSLDVATITSVMAALIKRRDSRRAVQLFRTLERRRGMADIKAYTSLIRAELESEDANAALDVFRFVAKFRLPGLRPDVAFYTIGLSALAKSGASAKQLLEFVEQMQEEGLRPNDRTFATLLVSLCKVGAMADAEHVFARMIVNGIRPSATHYTVMIRAYLRLHAISDADYFYSEMLAAGVDPSNFTISTLASAAKYLPETELQSDNSQLAAHIRNFQAQLSSGEYHHSLLAAAENESAHIDKVDFVGILDRYRRSGRTSELLSTWKRVFTRIVGEDRMQDALLARIGDMEGVGKLRREELRNELCVALSIVIDGLSEAGMHGEVALIWGDVRRAGYGFDAHNWNHLAIALVRAGRVEDAFRIVENVLTDRQPDAIGETVEERRAALFDAVQSPVRRKNLPLPEQEMETQDEVATDFSKTAHRSYWAPHMRTIAAIAPLVERLRRGQTLPRTKPSSNTDFSEQIDYDYMSEIYSQTVRLVDEFYSKQSSIDTGRARSQEIVEGRLA